MARALLAAAAAAWFFVGIPATEALAQKAGGVLSIYNRDSPPSMSILEESALSTVLPMMGVFNNLVIYDQHLAQNSAHLAPGQQVYCSVASLRSWEEGGDVAVFDRDTFYIRLMPPEVAQAAIVRSRSGI